MAFPTQGDLDDFNRADSASLGSNWTEGDLGNGDGLRILSNLCEPTVNGALQDARWNVETFGPDSEVFVTYVNPPSGEGFRARIALRVVQPGDATWDGYTLDLRPASAGGIPQFIIVEVLNNVSSEIGIRVTPSAFNDGDRAGLEAIGDGVSADNLKGYRFDGSSWSEILSRQNDDHQAAGYIAMVGMEYNTSPTPNEPRMDDFGGGTVGGAVAGGLFRTPNRLTGVGVGGPFFNNPLA